MEHKLKDKNICQLILNIKLTRKMQYRLLSKLTETRKFFD